MTVEFSFELDKRYIKHIKEKSYYNHNYYSLDLQHYGDYILYAKCNILYEECDDFSDSAYYSLGYYDEDGKFQAMWTWLENEHKRLGWIEKTSINEQYQDKAVSWAEEYFEKKGNAE